nr:hypothetical protein [Pseudomonadota bacterium]
GTIVACGMWLQHYLLFVPTLYQDHIPLDITEVAIALGFFGAYVLCFCGFLARVPLMPFGDLYLDTPNEPLR